MECYITKRSLPWVKCRVQPWKSAELLRGDVQVLQFFFSFMKKAFVLHTSKFYLVNSQSDVNVLKVQEEGERECVSKNLLGHHFINLL